MKYARCLGHTPVYKKPKPVKIPVDWDAHKKELKACIEASKNKGFVCTHLLLETMKQDPEKYPLFSSLPDRNGKGRITMILRDHWAWAANSRNKKGHTFVRGAIP